MNDIVTAVYNLMGHPNEDKIDDDRIKDKVERLFNVSNNNKTFLIFSINGIGVKRLMLHVKMIVLMTPIFSL
jgi:hypothetical protein